MKKNLLFTAVLSLLATSTLLATPYSIDTAHSGVEFKIKHLKVSNVKGNFSKFEGTFDYDEKSKVISNLTAKVDINSINTNNDKRDDHLKSADFFDATKYENMSFKMSQFIPKDNDEGVIVGDLTIKNITKPVKFEYDLGGIAQAKDGKSIIGFSLQTDIARSEFDVGEPSAALGDKVKIEIQIEAKQR